MYEPVLGLSPQAGSNWRGDTIDLPENDFGLLAAIGAVLRQVSAARTDDTVSTCSPLAGRSSTAGRGDWTQTELRAIVADYFGMLESELAGLAYRFGGAPRVFLLQSYLPCHTRRDAFEVARSGQVGSEAEQSRIEAAHPRLRRLDSPLGRWFASARPS